MILTDNEDAVKWFKKSRYEGRNELRYEDDNIDSMGWNMYMTPMEAALGLMLMQNIPQHNDDLPEDYKDLTKNDLFK